METRISLDLDGNPLKRTFLNSIFLPLLSGSSNASSCHLLGYEERDEERGLMSHTCRLVLSWSEAAPSSSQNLPISCFYKRIDMYSLEHLRYKALEQPTKVARDVKSYEVETSFLASHAIKALMSTGTVSIPKCYHADKRKHATNPIESKFALLLEDFSPNEGWAQVKMLSHEESKAALLSLARFHAFFLPNSSYRRSIQGRDQENELEQCIWNSGGYWQPNMQPNQMEILKDAWEGTHMRNFDEAFKNDDYLQQNVDLLTLGERLQDVATMIGAEAHPFSGCEGTDAIMADEQKATRLHAIRTVIHGDPKQGNIFLRKSANDAVSNPHGIEIALIDFQWTGFGLPGTDVGHFLCASRSPDSISHDFSKEAELLDVYYDAFCTAAVDYGAATSRDNVSNELMSRMELEVQTENGILDTIRCVLGYQWLRVNATPELLARNSTSIARNAYNKSLPNALWLISACDRLLKNREKRLKSNVLMLEDGPAGSSKYSDMNTSTTSTGGGEDAFKLSELGPIIINSDGSMSRIPNWATMDDNEKATAQRLIAKRNERRKKELKQEHNREE